MVQSKKAKFYATYKRQNFSLPDSIMYYIAKNPTSSELYEKMNESYKYFFVKNPIFVTSELNYYGGKKWELSSRKRPIDLSKFWPKLWITDRLEIQRGRFMNNKILNQHILSSLMPKLYQCDAKTLNIYNQIISYRDLRFLVSSTEEISFYDITVKDENDSNVGIEKIVEVAVKTKRIIIWSDTKLLNITLNTMKELIKIPHFTELKFLLIDNIPETFDLETFFSYLKKNKTTKISLGFDDSVSEAYKNRLEEIVDEILSAQTHAYKPTFICFFGLAREKRSKLLAAFHSH